VRWLSVCILVLTILVSGGCGSGRHDEDSGQSAALHGANSGIKEYQVVLISDWQTFSTMWQEHAGEKTTAPSVDFTRDRVVAFFLGERFNVLDLVLHDVVEETDTLTLRFKGLYRSTSVGSSFVSYPYHWAIIPRTDKRVVVLWEFRRERNAPSEWAEQKLLSLKQP
jgi:hypothetical protein